jgi:predicted metal-dependent enzyme (double-stranded beta helix superfamily)
MVPPTSRRPPLATLPTAIAPGRRPRVDPGEVASRLAPAVHWPGALDNETRSWRLMARTADFDAWLIAWPRGGKVDLHDHGASTGAVSVISGVLVEAVPWRDDTGQLSLVRHELQAGATLGFGPGHVHDVTNESDEHALSLHVYSPALTSMTFYELSGDQLVVRDVAWSPDGSGEFEHAMEEVAVAATAAAAR